ncbi:type II toxin-antitoxin system VapC family toxin [Capnocytophaga canis]|uniref:type II toxin-antitoxin system VapC family toxin n=1 Tax=Capnocytophaga canis TaxID=1848903 RepID=UPI001561DD26|nr:type II toxin-antitoxin system VapC family toxin [Capnocytophaga canis]
MRYLLDTNILIFILLGKQKDELSSEIRNIIDDYSNIICTSSICVTELVQLYRIGKIKPKYKTAEAMVRAIENEFYIEVLPFDKNHTKTLSKLQIIDGHNDPFDHSIISHAITDKLFLVSSDGKFDSYTPQKLKFVYNKR